MAYEQNVPSCDPLALRHSLPLKYNTQEMCLCKWICQVGWKVRLKTTYLILFLVTTFGPTSPSEKKKHNVKGSKKF